MKIFHLSDLHIGKRLNEFSLLEDQAYILQQILDAVDAETPDAVLLAGDIYDKASPTGEAVRLFDDFLSALAKKNTAVFVISGNHDSPERLAFGGRIMRDSRVHLSPVYNGNVTPVSLTDAYGTVDIFLLPFIKPAHVRRFFPEEAAETYTDAVRVALSNVKMNPENRNVLVTHQFVRGAAQCDSETSYAGGTEQVDASVFDAFDYVALGHLHGPQHVGRTSVRYSGTPLKYSFSEIAHKKSITVVEFLQKGAPPVLRFLPLTPMRDLKELRGTYAELVTKSFYDTLKRDDYYQITLTDEEDVPEALGLLRTVYPNIMHLVYDNHRTRSAAILADAPAALSKTPLALFNEFYEQLNGQPPSPAQTAVLEKLIAEIWEDNA